MYQRSTTIQPVRTIFCGLRVAVSHVARIFPRLAKGDVISDLSKGTLINTFHQNPSSETHLIHYTS